MGSQKRILLAVFVALIVTISATTSLNTFGTQTNSPTQLAKPTASRVIDPSSSVIPNGDFEDPTVNSPGLYAFPNGWTTENHGGYTGGSFYSRNTNIDSYSGSRCWEMYINADNGWKNIWYYLPGSGAPDLCAFAVKIAEGNNSHDIVQVKIKDLTKSVGVNVELIYEFSNDSEQVMPSNTYQKVIHEPADYGAWYYRIKDWKTDWYNKYNGSQADMNDHWALLLGTNTYDVYDTMVARFDAIWMSNLPSGGSSNSSTLPLLLISVSVSTIAVILLGLIVVRARRSRGRETIQASPSEVDTQSQVVSEKGRTRSIGKCMVCNLDVYDGEDVRWCRFCGSLAHKVHLLEWVHVKGGCPICKNRLEIEDLK